MIKEKWFPIVITIGFLIVGCLAMSIVTTSIGTARNSHPLTTTFDINVGESTTFHYTVDKQKPLLAMGMHGFSMDKYETVNYGYVVATTKNEGKYNIFITTDCPQDTVYMRWSEAYDALIDDDKFGNSHWEPVVMWGSRIEFCTIDKHSDCNMDMSLRTGLDNPHIDVYIAGVGSGDITIKRVE